MLVLALKGPQTTFAWWKKAVGVWTQGCPPGIRLLFFLFLLYFYLGHVHTKRGPGGFSFSGFSSGDAWGDPVCGAWTPVLLHA